jgi:hypothetical protein
MDSFERDYQDEATEDYRRRYEPQVEGGSYLWPETTADFNTDVETVEATDDFFRRERVGMSEERPGMTDSYGDFFRRHWVILLDGVTLALILVYAVWNLTH